MSNNLFISYEVFESEVNEAALRKAISNLGNATPLLNNCWYINSPYNSDEALKLLSRFVLKTDKLLIVNTSTDSVCWIGFEEKYAQRIRQNWKMKLALRTA